MNLDYHLDNILRAAKFGAVGDKFTLQVSGQGDWNQQDGAPSNEWFRQLLKDTGYNITDSNIQIVNANPLGFAYDSRYAFWFQVDDELSGGTVTDGFNQLSDVVKPYFDNYTISVTNSSVTPVSGTDGGTGITGHPITTNPTKPPVAPSSKPLGFLATMSDTFKIPAAAVVIIGFSFFLYLSEKK